MRACEVEDSPKPNEALQPPPAKTARARLSAQVVRLPERGLETSMKAEDVAAWYFRLNGFFTITNFVLHPSRRGGQRTDADIVGVRFPDRAEFPDGPGGDDQEFIRPSGRLYFVVAESTIGTCKLNGPWTNSDKENIQAVLRDLGVLTPNLVASAAEGLYGEGVYDARSCYCSLFCVGEVANGEIAARFSRVPQRTWDQVLKFMYARFRTYHDRKADHDHWDDNGKALWGCWESSRGSSSAFTSCVRRLSGLRISA